MPAETIAIVNSTGRQAASLARVATAVGYRVRAQLFRNSGLVAEELAGLANLTAVEGSLEDAELVRALFQGAQLAFVNTVPFGDEVAIGIGLADAAKRAGVQHYVYSSMPDHRVFGRGWPGAPCWSGKFAVEDHIRRIGLPATFVYAGIYHNNFTSLPYPLFCLELRPDGSFDWTAPFHPDIPLPWLDAEHDFGPAVLQILKDGPRQRAGQRIALAFEMLTPLEACAAFERGLSRPVRYRHTPTSIAIRVPVPHGYREQLDALVQLFGICHAPYFGPDLHAPHEARRLWEGYRGLEEYAREVFPLEEAANARTWMT